MYVISVAHTVHILTINCTDKLQIQAGANASRGDDVKTLKVAILEWIADPVRGLVPPIPHSGMTQRGFRHEVTGRELCPAGLDWNDPRCAGL